MEIPEAYLRQVHYDERSQRQLLEEREKLKITSRSHPDSAGESTEEIFASLIRKLIPNEFKVVTRARIDFDDLTDSPQLDLVILKPGGEKRLNDLKSYHHSSVLAAFECKLTLRKRDLEKAAETANAIKCDFANGMAYYRNDSGEKNIGTCRPYFGILALGWEQGGNLDLVKELASTFLDCFRNRPIGRQVDIVLIPDLSFYWMHHENDHFDQGIDLWVSYETIYKLYHWPDGRDYPAPPLEMIKGGISCPYTLTRVSHQNPLTGFAYYLACVIDEFSPTYSHMASQLSYYLQYRVGTAKPHSPPTS